MGNKYTPATALAIKRDVQKSQEMLVVLNQEIEKKYREKEAIDAILDAKRGLLARFEDAMVGVFSRGLKHTEHKRKRISELDNTISKLETARDLLTAEVQLRKEEVVEPAGALLVQSLINQLEPVLNKLLMDIDRSETELEELAKKKEEFIVANAQLEKEALTQEEKVKLAQEALAQANNTRAIALAELAKETQQLNLIQERKQAGRIMEARLSDGDYRTLYQNMPRRGKK